MKDALRSVMRAIAPRTLLDIAKEARSLSVDRRAAYVKRRLQRTVGAARLESVPRPAHSVLFVCHGNIMRSAAAAGFLREELRAGGITNVTVGSAGTHAHIGRPADPRAQDAARELGLSLDDHTATRITRKLVADYDVIFAMDDLNYVNILKAFPESRAKLMLLGGMRPSGTYPSHEIADPYMASSAEISATIAAIKRYVRALAHALGAHRAPLAPTDSAAAD